MKNWNRNWKDRVDDPISLLLADEGGELCRVKVELTDEP